MLHSRAEEGTPGPFSREDLAGDLARLGVGPGETVMVHASLRAVGWITGGPVALLQALRDVVGPAGTVVVPTFTTYLGDPSTWVHRSVPEEWWPRIRRSLPPFNPELHAAQPGLGRFPEVVRSARDSVRSSHPVYSLTAVGPAAGALLADHPLDYGLGSSGPLARLARLARPATHEPGARVLLLGVGWDKCTLLHLGEHLTPYPGRRSHRLRMPVSRRRDGTVWRETDQLVLYEGDYAALGAEVERTRGRAMVGVGTVGAAPARLADAPALVAAATAWLAAHRDLTAAVLPPYLTGARDAPRQAL